jgi:hypothetical protein
MGDFERNRDFSPTTHHPLAVSTVSILDEESASRGQMTATRIDWVVMWKLFHNHFFWIYVTLGIPLRLILVRRLKVAPASKTTLYVFLSSFTSSLLCTWFPIIPIISGAVLILIVGDAAGHAAGESLLIGVPLVAFSMAIETAVVDAVLLRWFLKESVNKRLVRLLVTNLLNASIALVLGLAWEFHHMPIFIAALDS